MTPEKRYAAAAEIIRALARFQYEQADFAETVIKAPEQWMYSPHFPSIAAAASILEEARAEMDKATTGAGRLAALKRIASEGAYDTWRGQFEYSGKWYICTGYQLLIASEPWPASIPTLKEAPTRDITRAIPVYTDFHEITLDRAAIKAHKADPANKISRSLQKPFIIRDGAQNIGISARLALDTLAALPAGNMKVYARRPIDPIMIEIDGTLAAMLMPVRVDQPKKEEDAA